MVSLLAGASLVLSACGGAPGERAAPGEPRALSQTEWDEVVAKAEQEGKVVVYASMTNTERVFAEFEKAYPGISVTVERAPTSDLIARLDQELEVGAAGADVAFHPQPAWFEKHAEADNLAALQLSPAATESGWEDYASGHEFVPLYSFPYVLGYNTARVQPVASIEELVEKAGNARIGITDPAVAPSVAHQYDVWKQAYGDDLFERLGKLRVTQVLSSATLVQGLASGEFDYVVGIAVGNIGPLAVSGAPVAEILPADNQTGPIYNGTALATAAHPNASQVFLNWLMSEEGQQLLIDEYSPGSVPLNPEGGIPWGQIKAHDESEWAKANWDTWLSEQWRPNFS